MDALPTPSVVVDEQIVDDNIKRMAEYAKMHQLNLRPHIKTHKSKVMAQKQLQAGAVGLTVAKVGEAEIMSEVCGDLFMAFPPVDEERCRRLAELAGKVTVRVGLDSTLAAENLGRACNQRGTTAGILVDFDLGFGRTGVQSIESAIALSQLVAQTPNLRLDGIMLYTGHVLGDARSQTKIMSDLHQTIHELVNAYRSHGLNCEMVSSGSTPAAYHSHLLTDVTEIRPGTYIYNDMNTIAGSYCEFKDAAAKIHATVISNAVPNQIVIDAGTKTLTSDLCGPARDSGHGCVVEYPKAKIVRLTEEHGQIDISCCDKQPELGQQLTIIPNHICVCINMQNQFWLRSVDGLKSLPVDARGMLI